jgi:hypothetical protein
MTKVDNSSRKSFLKSTLAFTASVGGLSFLPNISSAKTLFPDERANVIGPRVGFSPHIGTLLSMMTWMRTTVLRSVKDITQEQLDYLHDAKSNTIGSMLFHLAATERFYQIHTFEGKKWGDWDESDKAKFEVAMELGDEARNTVKGNNLSYYIDALNEVRNNTTNEFKKRDDNWLMSVDEKWYWGPTNNYCKWFHVCEHESNHNGQIKWIKSRISGKK